MTKRSSQTFCPRLWDEIYIDPDGDVFSCCHGKPMKFGNIYTHHLREICNNAAIQGLRTLSLQGRLGCYRSCTLLNKENIRQTQEGTQIEYGNLSRLKIMFGEQCNIDCIMCWQHGPSKKVLDCEVFIKNVDITPFNSIEIQGGEPLYIKQALKFFDYAASQGKKVSFLTNGMLINDQWAEKIARHSAFIHFSLNAATAPTHERINRGSRWTRVMENIQRVRSARDKHNSQLQIRGHMTIVIQNLHEIPQFIRNYVGFGFDWADFGCDYKVPFYLRLHPSFKKGLKAQISEALRDVTSPDTLGLHHLKLLGLAD